MDNLLVTFVKGDEYISNVDCGIFMKSLQKFSSFKKLCVYKDLNSKNVARLEEVFDYVHFDHLPSYLANNDRYLAYYLWLQDHHNQFKNVMHVDFRDVIVQKDPFEYIDQHPDIELYLVAEGMNLNDSECNLKWAKRYNDLLYGYKMNYDNSRVINSGTMAGKTHSFMQLCVNVMMNIDRPHKYYVYDQAILNYLYPVYSNNKYVQFSEPKVSDFVITGEGVKEGYVHVKYEDGLVKTLDGKDYHVLHQWDRFSFAEDLRNRYK